MSATILQGDCLAVLRGMADNSVDSIVTDPPYGLSDHKPTEVLACLSAWIAGQPYEPKGKGFMGKKWDAWVPGPEVWRECLRVLKPGGHALIFAGTRSMDLMSMAVRLAGFELRDSIGYAHDGGGAPLAAWCYASGFPKSLDVSRAIDKAAGVRGHDGAGFNATGTTEAARQWQGWGTALKPAWEPIILARKPLIGTVAENVLTHGTGALNIEGCRVEPTGESRERVGEASQERRYTEAGGTNFAATPGIRGGDPSGRWPANLIHDGSEEVIAAFPISQSVGHTPGSRGKGGDLLRGHAGQTGIAERNHDAGSAARFFYCAKASRADRNEGMTDPGPQFKHGATLREVENAEKTGNTHPTVKPTALMRYLCRLVTPPGGTVLDPYFGSGSTGKAAILEGFSIIGIERDDDSIATARARCAHAESTIAGSRPATADLFGDAA